MSEKVSWIIVVLICTAYIVGRVLWGRHRPRPPFRKMGLIDVIGVVILLFFFLLLRSKARSLGLPLGGPIALLAFFVLGALVGELFNWVLTRLG